MLVKAIGCCFGAAVGLATVGFAAAEYAKDQGTQPSNLDSLATTVATICFIACLVLIGAGLLFVVAFLFRWTYRYFHAVQVMPGQWYPRYWPLQRIAHVSGIWIKHEEWGGDVELICQAQFGSDVAIFNRTVRGHSSGTYSIDFPQQPVDFLDDPEEGNTATIVVTATPSWWRGRPSQLIQQAPIGITDHRGG